MERFDGAIIEILNWDKFNPKRDQSTYSWLRLSNNIATDPSLFGLDAAQKFVWITMLCQASKENQSTIKVNIKYLSHVTGVEISSIVALLDFLENTSIISTDYNARSSAVARGRDISATLPLRTNERTIKRANDICATAKSDEINLEQIYQAYPRKIGKKQGMKKLARVVKSQADFERVQKSVRNYTADCWAKKTGLEFIKHFSTFMNCWEDWENPLPDGLPIPEPKTMQDLLNDQREETHGTSW